MALIWWIGSLAGLWARHVVQPSLSVEWSELWVLTYQGWSSPSHISEFLSRCPDLWFWPFQAPPQTWHTLDLTVMADSDSTLDCQRCPKSPLCSCSIQMENVKVDNTSLKWLLWEFSEINEIRCMKVINVSLLFFPHSLPLTSQLSTVLGTTISNHVFPSLLGLLAKITCSNTWFLPRSNLD